MKRNLNLAVISGLICGIFIVLVDGCTVKTPEVTFTSERTALEKQILGSYRTIEEDAWMVASVRSEESEKVAVPESKRRVLEAFADRKFNADDIGDFKRDAVVGENAQGMLTIRPTSRYEEDNNYRATVDRIVAAENADREVIMDRIVEINSSVNPLDSAAVMKVFAQMNRDASPRGTWIETEDGRWLQK